ncbi:OmpA family protein [Endozoicomonas ascidiicola]|uniref:OmpA family protein n=1 Tax=Endozoicomonas ascidiicola TaxID=1698521 RepID=UPI000836EC8A|nr:OmpA family protein [Endozoicomonas ascidiicola]
MKVQGFARSVMAMAIGMAVCGTAVAQDAVAQKVVEKGFTISAGASYNNMDTHRNTDNTVSPEIGVGYRYNNRISVEGVYSKGSSDIKDNGGDVDLKEFRLDAFYDLTPWDGSFTPYVVAGASHFEMDADNHGAHDDTRVNAGFGVRKALTENLSLRGDLRAVRSMDYAQTESMANVALTWTFGAVAPVAAPVVAEEVIVAPVVVVLGNDNDNDNDGVIDQDDQCPSTLPGATVDATGCEVSEQTELMVNFGTDSANVDAADMPIITEMAEFLKRNQNVRISIIGYTDNTGPAAYNQKLSEKRASAIRQILVDQHGIDAARIEAAGMGEESPIASNDTAEGREQNRRVMVAAAK